MDFVITADDHLMPELQPIKEVAEFVDLLQPAVTSEVACMYEDVAFLFENAEVVGLTVCIGNAQYLQSFFRRFHLYNSDFIRQGYDWQGTSTNRSRCPPTVHSGLSS